VRLGHPLEVDQVQGGAHRPPVSAVTVGSRPAP
jgi:hypothetical protein